VMGHFVQHCCAKQLAVLLGKQVATHDTTAAAAGAAGAAGAAAVQVDQQSWQ